MIRFSQLRHSNENTALLRRTKAQFSAPKTSPDHSIGRSDGRCVQRAGTYSARSDEPRLREIPRWRPTVARVDPQHDRVWQDCPGPVSAEVAVMWETWRSFTNRFLTPARKKTPSSLTTWRHRSLLSVSVLRVRPRTSEGHHRPVIASLFHSLALKREVVPLRSTLLQFIHRRTNYRATSFAMVAHNKSSESRLREQGERTSLHLNNKQRFLTPWLIVEKKTCPTPLSSFLWKKNWHCYSAGRGLVRYRN